MKVLFFINTLSSGGKERRLTELMKGLKENPEIEFELAVMSSDIHYKEIFDLNIRMHYIIRRTKKDLSVFGKLYSLCKKIQPDILHCWDGMTAVYAALVCKKLKIKLVNGMVVNTPLKKNIFNQAYLRAKLTFPFSDLIIGNSKAGLAAYQAPEKKSICIYNGFDFDRLNKLTSGDLLKKEIAITTKYVIGMVASFSKLKDYKTYFSAALSILEKRNDVTFIAIGNNTDSDTAKAMIHEKNISYFRFLGKRSDVESLINIFDISVLSTFTEGISNSILEYMALGKSVIATTGGGTSEIVVDNETGFLVDQQNPDQLSEKMLTLLNNADLRSKMGSAGKQRISNFFSIREMIGKYELVYKNLLAQSLIHPIN